MTAKVRDYYAEETAHLLSFGTSPSEVAQRLGIQPASLARALHREGRHDLAAPFERLRGPRRKPGKCACGNPTSEVRRTRCYPCGIAARDRGMRAA